MILRTLRHLEFLNGLPVDRDSLEYDGEGDDEPADSGEDQEERDGGDALVATRDEIPELEDEDSSSDDIEREGQPPEEAQQKQLDFDE